MWWDWKSHIPLVGVQLLFKELGISLKQKQKQRQKKKQRLELKLNIHLSYDPAIALIYVKVCVHMMTGHVYF